jgi:hypothetical protein
MATAVKQKAKQSKKQRKFGRNAVTCDIYRREGRETKNKIRRLRKRVANHPNDRCAVHALAQLV